MIARRRSDFVQLLLSDRRRRQHSSALEASMTPSPMTFGTEMCVNTFGAAAEQATSPSTTMTAAVARLDAWLDTMRGENGYGGPVAHWWQQNMLYTGAGLDWRYEGIIAGYVELWQRSGDQRWLAKARRAGDDLLRGQQINGHYHTSAFEANPAIAALPHEAAADLGLLRLAAAMRNAGQPDWEPYVACAARNIRMIHLEQLWNADAHVFYSSAQTLLFVPAQVAALCEALFLLAEIIGEDYLITEYALPTLNQILAHQIVDKQQFTGAIACSSCGSQAAAKYFPLSIARCVSALLHGYRWCGDERYIEGALRAMHFVLRWTEPDGTLPAVVYANRRVARHPAWIAPLGDVLSAAAALQPFGFDHDFSAVEQRLLNGQDASGGIQTAAGFAGQAGGSVPDLPDVRDVLHVVGWCDKAFRYLASQADPELPVVASNTFETDCTFRGQVLHLEETPDMLEISDANSVWYRWRKGEAWPEIAKWEFWLR